MSRKANFRFTNKKHSPRAIMATILGIICILSLVISIYLSYAQGGKVVGSFGVTGILVVIFSITGLVLSIVTSMEKDQYPLFSILGIVLNSISLAGISFILYAGTALSNI